MTRRDVPVDPHTPTEVHSTADTIVGPGEAGAGRAGTAQPGEYRIGELIGRGGMGEVLVAHDPTIGRDVALKRLRAETPSAELVERFLREARIQARLDHPAIVPVHELGRDGEGRPFFTMKRVAGTTLMELLEARSERLPRLLRGLVEVALAVELAHTRRVVHRDLKPSNIMLGDYGEVYVLDWGVARVLADDAEVDAPGPDIPSLDGETRAGTLLGTPGYMAPEQARGEAVGPAADVYALGAILFEVLAGEPLHPHGSTAAIASTISGTDGSPAKRRPERAIAPELDAACAAALAMNPAARPTARALANAIQAYLDGDRDLERRRAHAADLVAESRRALAAGDEAKALNAAGRAAVFDPTSAEANDLVIEMLVDRDRPLPAALRSTIAADDSHRMREHSRRAFLPLTALFVLIPLLPLMHVLSWTTIGVIYAAIGNAALWLYVATKRDISPLVTLAANLLVVIAFTRVAGPFVLTPILISTILLSATTLPQVIDAPWKLLSWTVLAAVLPFALEHAGVLGTSWSFDDVGLHSYGTVFASDTMFDRATLVGGQVLATLVVGAFAWVIGRDRLIAQRQVLTQVWRLQQLLPRAT